LKYNCRNRRSGRWTGKALFGSKSWAGQKPEACEDIIENEGDAFIRFQHIYSCFENGPKWDATQGACLFKPKVYVKDNWGWCNRGVYADSGSCLNTSGAGTSFAGQIKITPFKE